MPRTNGVFTFTKNADFPAVAGTEIVAADHNTHMREIEEGLTRSLAYDGQTEPISDLPMHAHKHTNVGDATAKNQYLTAGQSSAGAAIYAGAVSLKAGTTDTLAIPDSNLLLQIPPSEGQLLRFKVTQSVRTPYKLALGQVVFPLVDANGAALPLGFFAVGSIYGAVFDGARFLLLEGHPLVEQHDSQTLPAGTIVQLLCTKLPSPLEGQYLLCDGSLHNRADYPQLWEFIQKCGLVIKDPEWSGYGQFGHFSSGNGTTTFRVPDLRAMLLRGSGETSADLRHDGHAAGTFQKGIVEEHGHSVPDYRPEFKTRAMRITAGKPDDPFDNGEYWLYGYAQAQGSAQVGVNLTTLWYSLSEWNGSPSHAYTLVNGNTYKTTLENSITCSATGGPSNVDRKSVV